jgi:predicted ferric reductase
MRGKIKPHAAARAWVRIALYLGVIASAPVAAVTLGHGHHESHRLIAQIAKTVGLVGYAVLALQFVLAARLKWIERPFGLDKLFAFHKAMGLIATTLLVAHPLLMAWARRRASLLYRWDAPWPIHVGRVALLLLVTTVVIACVRKVIRLEYERWRRWHNILAVSVLVLGFVHRSAMGVARTGPMGVLWAGLLGAALIAYFYHRIYWPYRGRLRPFEIVEVHQETPEVWTLRFRPTDLRPRTAHLPGQFHFITFYRNGLPIEEHPFTISSAAEADGSLTSTIKASGDFTRKIARIVVGDRAAIRGPFGRFSHILHPDDDDLVFIAGGVGITPLMSMLRHMRNTGRWKRVLLIYGNRREEDIVFRAELDGMAQDHAAHLTLVHVLSGADAYWQGARGRIDRDLVFRHAGERIDSKAFYVCGPPAMTTAVIASLRELGVPARRIHNERFSL